MPGRGPLVLTRPGGATAPWRALYDVKFGARPGSGTTCWMTDGSSTGSGTGATDGFDMSNSDGLRVFIPVGRVPENLADQAAAGCDQWRSPIATECPGSPSSRRAGPVASGRSAVLRVSFDPERLFPRALFPNCCFCAAMAKAGKPLPDDNHGPFRGKGHAGGRVGSA